MDRFISWLYVRKIFGPRCSVFDGNCIGCQKWAEHDELFAVFHDENGNDVIVKLEWVEHPSGRWSAGPYDIIPIVSGEYGLIGTPMIDGCDEIFPTLEAAQAAAYDDLCNRVKELF